MREGITMKPKAIIVDLDGTLADVSHRRPFLDETPPDWKSFNESCIVDPVNGWCKSLVLAMYFQRVAVIVTSGRWEEFRDASRTWLDDNGIPFAFLYLRQNGDQRSDAIVKEEILNKEILPRFDVLFAVDDRKSVVEMWRRNGIVCLQCAEGDF